MLATLAKPKLGKTQAHLIQLEPFDKQVLLIMFNYVMSLKHVAKIELKQIVQIDQGGDE